MKRLAAGLLLLSMRAASAEPQTASTSTLRAIALDECYALALRRSEELAQRGEAVAELEARVAELWSALRPRVSLVGTETVQDTPRNVSGISTTFTQRHREQAQVAVRQPLFSGLREFLAARAAKVQTRSAELALERARHLLYEDAARAYLDLLGARREIAIRQALVAITDERIEELNGRRKLGRSRPSELLAAESQRAQIEAGLAAARGAERVTQAKLRFLTGLEQDLEPRAVALPQEAPVEPFLAAAARRPDVEAARADRAALGYAVDMVRRKRWPTLNLDGNYYLRRPPGFQDRVKWDAVASLELPLYSGGSISAQVRQAEAARRSADQALSLAVRKAELEARTSHRDLRSALAVARALENAERLAQANAKAQAEDYRLGLVTNLEVLESHNALQETRLRLDSARLEAYWSRVRLGVAAGTPGETP